MPPQPSPGDRPFRIGFVPLTDAAPLLVADALGVFARHGVPVILSAEASWATLRDKLAFGALDAAHLLGPLAIALATGAGGLRRRVTVTAGLARNGNTLVLSPALTAAIGPFERPLDPARLAEVLHARAEDGMPPPTIAVVFPFSSHNYLLRHWLAAGGLDPDHDVRLVVVPPPRVARALAEGAIEGFCAGEPWGSHAVASGAGQAVLGTGDVWRDHPEKVLAFGEGVAERDEPAVVALTAAVIEAARWLEDPANRTAAARILQDRAFPELALSTIAAALDGRVAGAPGQAATPLAAPLRFVAASHPWREEAAAWNAAMRRWGHAASSAEDALAPWRADLWDRAAALVTPPPAAGAATASPLLSTTLESDA